MAGGRGEIRPFKLRSKIRPMEVGMRKKKKEKKRVTYNPFSND
jgi:hypothetical protein